MDTTYLYGIRTIIEAVKAEQSFWKKSLATKGTKEPLFKSLNLPFANTTFHLAMFPTNG